MHTLLLFLTPRNLTSYPTLVSGNTEPCGTGLGIIRTLRVLSDSSCHVGRGDNMLKEFHNYNSSSRTHVCDGSVYLHSMVYEGCKVSYKTAEKKL